jgi:hypothetical protein
MALSTRQGQILSQIEATLSPANLLQNPFLVSRVGPRNRISVSALSSIPPLVKLNASQSEIVALCARSQFVDVVHDSAEFLICPRFLVCPSVLIVLDVAKALSDFLAFVRVMNGNDRFQAFRFGDAIALHFEQSENCIALWRALRIVPFRGKCVHAYAHSMPLQAQAPVPAERTSPIVVEHRKRERPAVNIARVSHPA